MEERTMDEEELRKIRVKRNAAGGIEDVTELTFDSDGGEEEIVFEFPEGEDESLAGLSPAETKEELERRERAREQARMEYERLCAAAEQAFDAGDYDGAAELFSQAALYATEDTRAERGFWTAKTKNFEKTELLYTDDEAAKAAENEDTRALFLERAGGELRETYRSLKEEADFLQPVVEGDRARRREAFQNHRDYCLKRLMICFGLTSPFLIPAIISACFIVRTVSAVPLILTIVFGAIALIALGFSLFALRKYAEAARLVRENEKDSSTKDGARLQELREQLRRLNAILGD